MTDRLDARINALVIELLDHPVEPPPFPSDFEMAETPSRRRTPPGWAIAVAVFVAVLLIGVVSLILALTPDRGPVVDTAPQDVVEAFAAAINVGDTDATLNQLAEDAQCVVPGLPTCDDILGFFIAADARVVFTGCRVEIEPYVQCQGYLHTAIHEAMGISISDLERQPNFPPAFIIENGEITQFNFMTPFTGSQSADTAFWAYLEETGAPYLNEAGIPRFSAAIVPELLEAAQQFGQQSEE